MSDPNQERRKIVEMELRLIMPHAQSVPYEELAIYVQRKEIQARINLIGYYRQSGEAVSQKFLEETEAICDYDFTQLDKAEEAPHLTQQEDI
jgi:hypothetical protein